MLIKYFYFVNVEFSIPENPYICELFKFRVSEKLTSAFAFKKKKKSHLSSKSFIFGTDGFQVRKRSEFRIMQPIIYELCIWGHMTQHTHSLGIQLNGSSPFCIACLFTPLSFLNDLAFCHFCNYGFSFTKIRDFTF